MSDIPSGNRDFELLKLNSSVARFRRRSERLQKELEEREKAIAEKEELLGRFAAAYKNLKADPRLQVPMEQFEELQGLSVERIWQSHQSQFESALEGLTANGVTAKQILRAVGYDPSMVQELTPEIVRDVIETAYQEFPQLFSVATEPQQSDQAEPQDQSLPGQLTQDFAALSQRQAQGQPQSQTPSAQAVPNGFVPPQQPQQPPLFQQAMNQVAGVQQAPNPSLQFRGYGGDFQGRGGPAPTKSPVIAARLRDPAWLAANQGAVAKAVAEGAQIVDTPQ
jgi:hypothetical protein